MSSDNNQLNKKLKSDLDTYLEFVNLYGKERPFEAKREIEKIINEEKSIVVRIKRIKELDEKYGDVKDENADLDSTSIEETSKTSKDSDVQARETSFTLVANNFFQYLIFERSKLVSFGTRTQTISFKLFGIKKELSANAIVLWRQIYAGIRDHLFKQVNYALLNGWKILDPLSYNTLSTFNNFLIKFIKDGELLDRNQPTSHNLKVVESFIKPYLQLSHNPKYKEILKESLYEVLFISNEYKAKVKESIKFLEEVINTDKRTLGFFNIILAIYSLYYNRFIKLGDLLKYHKVKEIDGAQHDFNQKTLNEIKDYMEKINEELAETEDELFFLKFIDGNLKRDTHKDNDWVDLFNKLSLFSQLSTNKKSQNGFKEPQVEIKPFNTFFQDIIAHISKATQGFLANYSSILKGDFEVLTGGIYKRVSIFKPFMFKREIQDLEDLARDYEYMRTSGDVISVRFETYYLYTTKGNLDLEKEEKLCKMIEKNISNAKTIAYKIISILRNHYKTSKLSSTELLERYKTQNEPIDETQKERLIPFAFDNITHHPYLQDVKVIDVLNEIAFYTINLIHLFQEKETFKRFLERDTLLEKMETYLKLKAKVS